MSRKKAELWFGVSGAGHMHRFMLHISQSESVLLIWALSMSVCCCCGRACILHFISVSYAFYSFSNKHDQRGRERRSEVASVVGAWVGRTVQQNNKKSKQLKTSREAKMHNIAVWLCVDCWLSAVQPNERWVFGVAVVAAWSNGAEFLFWFGLGGGSWGNGWWLLACSS